MAEQALSEADRALLAEQPAYSFFALLLATQLLVAFPLQIANLAFGLAFSETFFFAGLPILWCLGSNLRPVALLRLGRPRLSLVLLGVLVGAANFMVSGTLQAIAREVLPLEWVQQFDASELFRGLGGLELAAVGLSVGVFAPVCEEIAFRGYLQTVLGARHRIWAVAITAGLFAALHLDPVGLVPRFELGVVFGLLVLWSGSLWPAVAAHAVNNLVASTALLAAARAGETPEMAEGTAWRLLPLGLLGLALLVGLLRAVREAAPSESLPPATPRDPDQPRYFEARRVRRPLMVWTALAVAALLALGLLGWRGVAVNFTDATYGNARIERRVGKARFEPLKARLEQAARRTRRGEVPLERYRALRRALAGSEGEEAPLGEEEIEDAFGAFEAPAPPGSG